MQLFAGYAPGAAAKQVNRLAATITNLCIVFCLVMGVISWPLKFVQRLSALSYLSESANPCNIERMN